MEGNYPEGQSLWRLAGTLGADGNGTALSRINNMQSTNPVTTMRFSAD